MILNDLPMAERITANNHRKAGRFDQCPDIRCKTCLDVLSPLRFPREGYKCKKCCTVYAMNRKIRMSNESGRHSSSVIGDYMKENKSHPLAMSWGELGASSAQFLA